MSTIEKAITLAAQAHSGQTDKGGHTYILHPLRVMLSMQTNDERIVAVLHDVVEDSSTTFEDLRTLGFGDDIVAALECLTKREGEQYEAFIERVRLNPLATAVKLADLRDNSDLTRLENPTARDLERIEKYRRASDVLLGSTVQ